MNHESLRPYVWMLCGAAAFAAMGACAHALRESCSWQVIALARAIVPLAITGTLALAGGVRLVFWSPPTLWMRSIAGSISLVCTFFAFTRLPVSDVLTLTNLFPVWVAVLSWPLLNERPSRDVWLAALAGVIGVALIQQPHIAEGNFASLAALVSSFASAFALIGLHRLQGLDARAVVFHFSCVALGFCLVALFVLGEGSVPSRMPATGDLPMLLGVGASATIGQLFLTKAFAAGPPAKVSVVGLTQVGFGVGFDMLLWHRSFGLVTLAGMSLIVAPTAWILLRRELLAD